MMAKIFYIKDWKGRLMPKINISDLALFFRTK